MAQKNKSLSKTRDLLERLRKNHGELFTTHVTTGDKIEIIDSVQTNVAEPQKVDKRDLMPIVYRRGLPRMQGSSSTTRTLPEPIRHDDMAPLRLIESLFTGQVCATDDYGTVYLVQPDLSKEFKGYRSLVKKYKSQLANELSPLYNHLERTLKKALTIFDPGDLIFTDIETTGLGNNPLFLIGIIEFDNGSLQVRQYLARDYSEEAAVIYLFCQKLRKKKLIVSFNGKSFDLPYIKTRAAANGVAFPPPVPHLDLLHVSRRIWKSELPDCKLLTLERHICGRTRYGDIPGFLIPQTYHDFVATGDATEMADILKHNMLDMMTLVELTTCLR